MMEDNGAGAVVHYSLFEAQINKKDSIDAFKGSMINKKSQTPLLMIVPTTLRYWRALNEIDFAYI